MALKQTYNTQAEIPETLRPEYTLRDGAWHLQIEGVESLTGIIAKNAELLSKHAADKAEITRLTTENGTLATQAEAARSSGLPRGHVAVPTADAQLFEAYKPLGTPDELKTVKASYGQLEQEARERKQSELDAQVAKILDYNEAAFALLLKTTPTRPEFELRDAQRDGKTVKSVIAKTKNGDAVTETEFTRARVEAMPAYRALKPALEAGTEAEGTPFPAQGSQGGVPAVDPAVAHMTSKYGWAANQNAAQKA